MKKVNMTNLSKKLSRIYGDECEKNVVGIIIYENNGKYFFDEEFNHPMNNEEVEALLLRGAVINKDGKFHSPSSFDSQGVYFGAEDIEVAEDETPASIIEDLLDIENTETDDTDFNLNLTKNFRMMLTADCIDYSTATAGQKIVATTSSTRSNGPSKFGFGHMWYLCNRDFTIKMQLPYHFCIIGLTDDMELVLNSGYQNEYTIKKYDPSDSSTFQWFTIILHVEDNTTNMHTAANMNAFKQALTSVVVSKEEVDNNSDFPLVLALTTFTNDGVMDGTGLTNFTTYGSDGAPYRNTLSLAYPIIGEEQIEQTVKTTGWYQGLIAYDADTGNRSHTPGRYPSMAWVETLKNENLFVHWSKTKDNGGITTSSISYDEAVALSENISIKRRSAKNPTPWVMGRDDEIKIYSHRIEAELSPKNSIYALEYGYNRGFRWFELDVRLTKDNIPVSSHDATYGNLSVPNSSYEQLCMYDHGGAHSPKFAGVRMLKLEDALIFASKMNCGLNIELKPMGGSVAWTKEKVQNIYDLVAKYSMTDHVVWNQNIYSGSETTNVLRWLQEIDSASKLILLNSSMTESFITSAAAYKNDNNVVEVYAPANTITQSLIDSAIGKGLKVGTHWVSGDNDNIDPTKFNTFKSMGIASIITESGNPTFYSKGLN